MQSIYLFSRVCLNQSASYVCKASNGVLQSIFLTIYSLFSKVRVNQSASYVCKASNGVGTIYLSSNLSLYLVKYELTNQRAMFVSYPMASPQSIYLFSKVRVNQLASYLCKLSNSVATIYLSNSLSIYLAKYELTNQRAMFVRHPMVWLHNNQILSFLML